MFLSVDSMKCTDVLSFVFLYLFSSIIPSFNKLLYAIFLSSLGYMAKNSVVLLLLLPLNFFGSHFNQQHCSSSCPSNRPILIILTKTTFQLPRFRKLAMLLRFFYRLKILSIYLMFSIIISV